MEVRLIKASKSSVKASQKNKHSACGQKSDDFWRGMKRADGFRPTPPVFTEC